MPPVPPSADRLAPAQQFAVAAHHARLMAAARRLRCRDPRAAAGRCLYLALEVAWRAARLGKEVRLLHWQVRDDPQFREHWAVGLEDGMVIDPTHVQVDGNPGLCHRESSYPPGFGVARAYPAALLLAAYGECRRHHRPHLPAGFLRDVHRRLMAHDLQQCRQGADWRGAIGALRRYLAFRVLGGVPALRRRLERRYAELAHRLAPEAVQPAGARRGGARVR